MARFAIFKKHEITEPAAHPLPHGAQTAEPPAPPIMLLTSDAAGPSVRRLHTFPDAASAANHVQFWFPVSERSSVIAFWALAHQPAAHQASGELNGEAGSVDEPADSAPPLDVEVVVLVQHPEHADSVYPFSFADLETANHFIRQEAKRGLDFRAVRTYWAAFARLDQTPRGEVTVTPQTPPMPEAAPVTDPTPEPVPRVVDPEQAPEARSVDPDPIAAYTPPTEPTTLREVINDLKVALAMSRTSNEPAFQGFGSPPGRF